MWPQRVVGKFDHKNLFFQSLCVMSHGGNSTMTGRRLRCWCIFRKRQHHSHVSTCISEVKTTHLWYIDPWLELELRFLQYLCFSYYWAKSQEWVKSADFTLFKLWFEVYFADTEIMVHIFSRVSKINRIYYVRAIIWGLFLRYSNRGASECVGVKSWYYFP